MNESNPALQEYIEWLALPPEEREIKTQHELAKKLGVNEPQLSKWKSQLNLYSAKPSEVKALFDNIVAEAKKVGCSPGLARLAWEITHPKDEVVKGEELSPDDNINIGVEFKDRIIAEYKDSGVCPVCGQRNPLYEKSRMDTGREQQSEDSVATVAVPD